MRRLLASIEQAVGDRDLAKVGWKVQREDVSALQKKFAALPKHAPAATREAKRQQISIAKADLEQITEELADAKLRLEALLQSKRALVRQLKRRLQDDDNDA